MSEILRLALVWFLSGALLQGAGQCGVSDKAVQQLIHYQAWSEYWMDTGQERSKYQEFRVLRSGTAWLVYSVPDRTAYRITESAVSAKTCWHHNEWMKCLAELRTPLEASTVSDLLLGKVKPAGPLDTGSICTFSLTVPPTEAKWRPSEESERKQQLLLLMGEEVSRAVTTLGTVQRSFCNNFNVDDPQIWAVVIIVGGTGISERLLVGVEVDHTIPIRMTASIIRGVASIDARLVQRIRRDSLRLTLKSR